MSDTAETVPVVDKAAAAPPAARPRAPKKEPAPQRPGESLLPISKVRKIVKADADVRLCTKEALFLISKATEYAVAKLASSAHTNAKLQKRNKLVKYQDLASVVQGSEWFYLQDVIPPTVPLSAALATAAAARAEAGENPSKKSASGNGLGTSAVKKARKKKMPVNEDAEEGGEAPASVGAAAMEVDG